MGEDIEKISIDQFRGTINILNPCMDDYLYIMDVKNDLYCISQGAVERFRIPSSQFHHALEVIPQFVYEEDLEALMEDLQRLINKEKDFHNIEYRWIDKKGMPVWINCRGRVLKDADGEPEYLVGCINEIGRKQKADNVSGLLGESSLQRELKNLSHAKGFILRLGIDNFKEINENKGIDYGDMILRKTAECIEATIRPEQKLYRIVADEFAVVDFSGASCKEAEHLYGEIRWRINRFIEDNGYEVFYTISAGILKLDYVEDQSYFNLMKLSEFALNEAKNGGKNKAYTYVEEDYRSFLHKKELIYIMRQAINHDFEGFEAYFQPIMDIKSNKLFSAETLLRFHTEETGMVSPGVFIPLLEETGLIIPVGKWVLHQAMKACRKIQDTIPDFKVSVNLSYIQVLKSNVLKEILEGVRYYGLNPDSIVVELTESGFLESDANFISFCNGLREHRIPLALDDFGTGYSNFHYLYNLNPSTIKIDRSFTLKALNNDYEYHLLQHMIDMTHSIDLKLCIEGIETNQELMRICQINPDFIQGFYFGRPCAFDEFMRDFVLPDADVVS